MKQLRFIIISDPNKNTADLAKEIKRHKHLVVVVPLKEISFNFSNKVFFAKYKEKNLLDFDIFIFRSYHIHLKEALILARELLQRNKIILDGVLGKNYISSKLFEASRLSKNKICHPETYQTMSLSSAKSILRKLSFPVLVKPARGMKGRGIKKISSKKEFLKFFSKNFDSDYLVQKYLETKSDLRVLVVGNKVLGGFERFIPEGKFCSNATPKTPAKQISITAEIKTLALAATKAMNYDVAGIDLLKSENKFYVLEVNSCPQWQKFKEITGINPAEEIISLAIKKYKKRIKKRFP